MQQQQQQDMHNLRQPKPPDRPLTAYMRFSRKMWPKVRMDNPESPLWDIGKIIGQLWRDASEEEKSAYQQDYELEKVEYEKVTRAYMNSPAYQQYLAARNRSKILGVSEGKGAPSKKGGGDPASMTGVIIQPVDEEDPFEMTGKRMSAIRFDRNNRLMSELFAPNYLPDTRSLVPQQRINQLRKQGESLAAHQNKLNDELKRLDENFNNRKRAMENSSEEFAVTLKKACEDKPQLGEDKYNELVAEWQEVILNNYEEYNKRQQASKARLEAERKETPVLYSLTCEKTPSPAQPMDVGEGASRPAAEQSSSAATSNDAIENMETTNNGQKAAEKGQIDQAANQDENGSD